jgi:hypothetical protein
MITGLFQDLLVHLAKTPYPSGTNNPSNIYIPFDSYYLTLIFILEPTNMNQMEYVKCQKPLVKVTLQIQPENHQHN